MRKFFSKNQRLKTNLQFKSVFDHKKRFVDDLLVIYMAPNELDYCRLGVSIGKRFGNAVRRNRLKRVLREAFRLEQHNLPQSFDYVVMYNAKLTKNKLVLEDVCLNQVQPAFSKLIMLARKRMNL